MTWTLREITGVPEGLLTLPVTSLWDHFGGPVLIDIPGRREPPLFLSALLHGNEHTGFLALQRWLGGLAQKRELPPRRLFVFLGNLKAARENVRRIGTEPDFNRIWRNPPPEAEPMVNRILELVRAVTPFGAVDLHNNSGKNPHYACVSRWEDRACHLAALFSRTVVLAEQPTETLCHAFSDWMPSVTLECGLSSEAAGIEPVVRFLDAAAHLSEYPHHPPSKRDIDGYRTLARLRVREGVRFAFSNAPPAAADGIHFREDLDRFNFSEVPKGTEWGKVKGVQDGILVEDQHGRPLPLLTVVQGSLQNTRMVVPAMLTTSPRAVSDDCLGYLMESI